jgi:PKD repeat protein
VMSLRPNQVISLTAQVSPRPRIQGFVTNHLHAPVADVEVYLFREPPATNLPAFNVRTNAQGYYEFPTIIPGDYWLWFAGRGYVGEYQDDQWDVAVPQPLIVRHTSGDLQVNAQLLPHPAISGRVTNLAGTALADVTVAAWRVGQSLAEPLVQTTTDAQGNYRLVTFPPGDFLVAFAHNGYVPAYYPNVSKPHQAVPVRAVIGGTTSGIDAVLLRADEVDVQFAATPRSGPWPLVVNFAALARGEVRNWAWDFGDGGQADTPNPQHTYTTPGVYTVTLTVRGAENQEQQQRQSYIWVSDTPITHLEIAGPAQVAVQQVAYFTATHSGGKAVRYAWDVAPVPASVTTVAVDGDTWQQSFTTPGQYQIQATVRNAVSVLTAVRLLQVHANGALEGVVPGLTLMYIPESQAGAAVMFRAHADAPDLVYQWEFGDGSVSAQGAEISHTFATPGVYQVTLTASNAQGRSQLVATMVVRHALRLPTLLR